MEERLFEIIRELRTMAIKNKVSICIDVSYHDFSKPILHMLTDSKDGIRKERCYEKDGIKIIFTEVAAK